MMVVSATFSKVSFKNPKKPPTSTVKVMSLEGKLGSSPKNS